MFVLLILTLVEVFQLVIGSKAGGFSHLFRLSGPMFGQEIPWIPVASTEALNVISPDARSLLQDI